MQTSLLALLRINSSWYIFVGVCVFDFGHEFCFVFWKCLPENALFIKSISNSPCGRISLTHIFGKFICVSFWAMYLFLFCLLLNYLNYVLGCTTITTGKRRWLMHRTLTIRLVIMVTNSQWMMMIFKLLVQGLNWIKIIHQLSETFFFTRGSVICKMKYKPCI